MSLYNPLNLKAKLVLLFSFLFTLVIFTVFFLSLNQQKKILKQEIEKKGRMTASYLALSARDAVLDKDLLTLNALIGAIQEDTDILHAYIIDQNDLVLMHTDVTKVSTFLSPTTAPNQPLSGIQTRTGSPSVIQISEPIRFMDKVIGQVHLSLTSEGIEVVLNRSKTHLIQTLFIGLVLGISGILFLSKLFLRPINTLAQATQDIAEGNLEVRVPVKSKDELAKLGQSFNIMTSRLKSAYEQVERGYFDTTMALAAAVEAKDPYTRGHCGRVSGYATEIGKVLKLSREEFKDLQLAAILHDIGKIGVKDEILTKPGRLTMAEMSIMRLHPQIGHQIMHQVEPLHKIAKYTLHHHEYFNGKGYPHGLKGDKIPLISRIITVADSFDSMSSNRPYRKALPESEVLKRLKAAKGRQFEPTVVDIFFELYEYGIIGKIKSEYSNQTEKNTA